MATKAANFASFVGRYKQYVESSIHPTRDLVEQLLARFKQPDLWAARAAESIYAAKPERRRGAEEADDEREGIPSKQARLDPNKHPVPSPIHSTKVRIKDVDSAYQKLMQEPGKSAGLKAIASLNDVLGARIVVYFPHQLVWMDTLIRDASEWKLDDNQKPKSFHDSVTLRRLGFDPQTFDARHRKQSGYSSLHYIVQLTESQLPIGDRPCFEIQVRTIAEELWGEIEHHIGYKPGRQTAFSVQRQFLVISEHLRAIDMHLDFIYDEMQHFQSMYTPENTDLLNSENLAAVLGKFGLRVSQQDLRRVAQILELFRIDTVGMLEERAKFGVLTEIRDEWRQLLPNGREPSAVEVLHVLFSLEPGEHSTRAVAAKVKLLYVLYQALRDEGME